MISQQGGTSVGYAPVVVQYAADPAYIRNGCLHVTGLLATWASGAQSESESVLTLCGAGYDYTFHFNRPADAPGLAGDLRIAEMRLAHRLETERVNQAQAMESAKVLGEAIGTLIALPD